jgi:serine/threonine-protein kinase HipA
VGRKSQTIKLKVHLQGNLVGEYIKNRDGATEFIYDKTWVREGFPISQTLPLITSPYKGDKVKAYFENLLPDLKEVRESIATRIQANSSDHFDLLQAIGHDCVGALLFIDREDSKILKNKAPTGTPLSDKEIGNMIRNLKSRPLGMEHDLVDFRISLAGVQEKTALLKWGNKWQRPLGVTPTTHIIKPPMKFETNGLDMRTSVHNEYFCMKLCNEFGLNVASVAMENFNGELVLVVERFDRIIKEDAIYRKSQEDMCQALGYFSNKKYQSDKGPGIKEFVSILETSVNRQKDLETMFKSLIVFFVIGAIDGHAKNYSIEYVKEGHQLAPLYDILSIFPALNKKDITIGKYKMALSVGKSNHYTAKRIYRKHFLETAKFCQIAEERANEIIDEVLLSISNEIWNDINYSKKFDLSIKNKIVNGIKILSEKLR